MFSPDKRFDPKGNFGFPDNFVQKKTLLRDLETENMTYNRRHPKDQGIEFFYQYKEDEQNQAKLKAVLIH